MGDWLRSHWRLAVGGWALVWPGALGFAGVWFARVLTLGIPPSQGRRNGSGSPQHALAGRGDRVWRCPRRSSSSASRRSRCPVTLGPRLPKVFATDSGLFVVLGVGIGGLLVPGFVFAGYGSGSPAGWAATWAACFCCLGLVLIPVALVLTIFSVDPRRLDGRRNRRMRAVVERSVRRELDERIARQLAVQFCEQHGMCILRSLQPKSKRAGGSSEQSRQALSPMWHSGVWENWLTGRQTASLGSF